jgi:hypothetical protein
MPMPPDSVMMFLLVAGILLLGYIAGQQRSGGSPAESSGEHSSSDQEQDYDRRARPERDGIGRDQHGDDE